MKRFLAALAVSLVACAPPITKEVGARPPTTAFVDVSVVPLDAPGTLAHRTVVVEGDRIVAIGAATEVRVPRGATIVDGRGKYLMPGLVDMHVHLNIETDLDLFVARGVTTVRNMWGAPVHLEWRNQIARGERVGPRIITAGPIVDGPRPAHDGSLIVETEDDADRAIALHRAAGYDFVKVYSRLSPPAYLRLVAGAKKAGLKVAGHVPREVGLAGVAAAQQDSVEHLTGFVDALQRDDSPVRGKFDRESNAKKLDFVDEAKIPALARTIAVAGVWQCPTFTVITNHDPAEKRRRLAAPEVKVIAPMLQAIWAPGAGPSAEALAKDARENALQLKIVKALRAAGARLLVGTDTGNPWVVPGYATHEELAAFVAAGLTPYEALRAATHDAAEYLGEAQQAGAVTIGRRADLLLVSGDPLADVANTTRIAGVMTRGIWFDGRALDRLVDKAARSARGEVDPFAGLPPLADAPRFAARFETRWKGARFGFEEVAVSAKATGELAVAARSFDAQYGQRVTLHFEGGASGNGATLALESDGTKGRGRAEISRAAAEARLTGALLSGPTFNRREPLADETILGASEMIASKVLLAKRLEAMAVGEERKLVVRDLALGSTATLDERALTVTRLPDAPLAIGGKERPARRLEITSGKGDKKETLWLDAQGFPLRDELPAYGSTVVIQRLE